MQTNAILTATSTAGKKISTTITCLRPSEKSHAVALAQALNALTTNSYVSTQVNEMNVDPSESGNKPTPTVTVANHLRVISPNTSYYVLDITASNIPVESIILVGKYIANSTYYDVYSTAETEGNPEGVLARYMVADKSKYDAATSKNFKIVAPETANYAPLYLDVTNITP